MGHVPVVEVLLNKCEFDLDKTDDVGANWSQHIISLI